MFAVRGFSVAVSIPKVASSFGTVAINPLMTQAARATTEATTTVRATAGRASRRRSPEASSPPRRPPPRRGGPGGGQPAEEPPGPPADDRHEDALDQDVRAPGQRGPDVRPA